MRHSDWRRAVYLLLLFIPIGIVLKLTRQSNVVQFFCAVLAIIPLSAIVGRATEEIAKRLGAQLGALVNATFGNSTELIVGLFALHAGLVDLVRASIIGSILGNILLVLGASALAGGLRYRFQTFNQDLAQTNSITLLLAAIAISLPAIFVHSFHTNVSAAYNPVELLSIWVAALLLVFYFLSLMFSLKTHEDLFRSTDSDEEKDPPRWPPGVATLTLACAAAAIAYESDILVATVQAASTAAHINQVFVGIIIVPIIGNAAENAAAIGLAMKNKMNVAINIAIGSSIQVAMFVAPFLVLVSLLFRSHLSIVFPSPELMSIAVAVVIAAFIANDGKTHWLEGAQLLAAYAIIALAFFFLPA
jgi:Ca2+:H+ antiporter